MPGLRASEAPMREGAAPRRGWGAAVSPALERMSKNFQTLELFGTKLPNLGTFCPEISKPWKSPAGAPGARGPRRSTQCISPREC